MQSIAEMTEIGESSEHALKLLEKTMDFYKVFQDDTQRAHKVLLAGQHLIKSQGTYPWIVVQPKCEELKRVCDLIDLRFNKRLDTLTKNNELMERVESVSRLHINHISLVIHK